MKKKFNGSMSFALVLCLVLSMFNVAPAMAAKVQVKKITLNKKSITLTVGKTTTLTAKVTPASLKKNVKWKSNKSAVVKVSKGKLTAKKVGIATVTAYIGKNKVKCKVAVRPKPAPIPTLPPETEQIPRPDPDEPESTLPPETEQTPQPDPDESESTLPPETEQTPQPDPDEPEPTPFTEPIELGFLSGGNGSSSAIVVKSFESLQMISNKKPDVFSKYDEAYFQKNAILLLYLGVPSPATVYRLTSSPVIMGDRVIVNAETGGQGGMTIQVVGHWGFLFEMKKSDIRDVSKVVVNGRPLTTSLPILMPDSDGDMFKKYDLNVEAYIWNDYMPDVDDSKSNSYVSIKSSIFDLPPIEVSVKIHASKDIETTFLCADKDNWGKWQIFRPANRFRLNDGEEYTMEVTLKVRGEEQKITFVQSVGTTY